MKVKKRIWILIMLVCVLLCACSIEDEYVETESVEEHFQPDYVKGEENKFMLSSRVVQQGSWIYFYNDREIMKMDENKNIYTVLNIEKVRGISVVGEWIYYATYEKMGKVRSDGELHEVLLQTASVGNFLVDGNMLYYFERYNVSATESNYAFHCYDMASKTDKFPDNGLGSKQYGGTVIGLYKDKLYLTYGEADKSQIYYIYTDTYDTKSDDLEATMLSIEGLENGIIYNDKLLYFKRVSIGFFFSEGTNRDLCC